MAKRRSGGAKPQQGGGPAGRIGAPRITYANRPEDPTTPPPNARPTAETDDDTFIHPYNFVDVPTDGLGKAADVAPFKRVPPADHDRFDSTRLSGHVDCTLTTRTHWFIPHPEKRDRADAEPRHQILGYFTLDKADSKGWDRDHPDRDATRPAIPASSLRGMVRSVFEPATLSCLAVFDERTLDYRIGFDPSRMDEGETVPPDRGEPSYLPVRVSRRNSDDGSVIVEVLDGRRPGEAALNPTVLPVALVSAYDPKVSWVERTRHGNRVVIGQDSGSPAWGTARLLKDGDRVACSVPLVPTRHPSRPFRFRRAETLVSADQVASLRPSDHHTIVFGYFHRTGPNIENKHDERVFFRWASYNDLGSSQTPAERGKQFLGSSAPGDPLAAPFLRVEAKIVSNAENALRAYAERHGGVLEKSPDSPRPINPADRDQKPPFPSDFVVTPDTPVSIKEGDLFYALIEDGTTVQGLYPVAMPRLTHENSRKDLLHEHFHPCSNETTLCAACRVFGWTRPGERRAPQPRRVDAVAGHVRFTHGLLRGPWGDRPDRQAQRVTLAILGSPKPTTTAFYLKRRVNFDQNRDARWPPKLRTAFAESIPLYRREEAALRGRKFYRRRSNVNPNSHNPEQNGVRREPAGNGQPMQDSQNRTVHLLPPELQFGFRVFFDNLGRDELGALLFALSLQPPDSWGADGPFRHALGLGKPLGLGACEIGIGGLYIDVFDPDRIDHRYAKIPDFTRKATSADDSHSTSLASEITAAIGSFGLGWTRAEEAEKLENPNNQRLAFVRETLIEMLKAGSYPVPIQYPPNPRGGGGENFKWFAENRGRGLLLPDPRRERGEPERRLPKKF